jgi:capsular exopolysaccharide synthesis family protein
MSVRSVEIEDASEAELQAALAIRCRMSPADLGSISAMMQHTDLSFSQSAMHLGFATQDDVDDAIAGLRHMDGEEKESLIEVAINKLSDDRQVVIHVADPVRPSARLVLAHDPYNPRSELIRALRTELLLRSDARQSNVICLVSPSPGEGRSQLAAELAIAFGQLGRRTLLVDADLRRPTQHDLFSTRNVRGLSDALMRGERPYVYPVEGMPAMSLLTTGELPPNPLELISSGRFERLLQDWRKSYEFVVIDTPPVTQCADALAIATFAGRVLFVVRAEHTRYKDTQETLRRLATTRAEILGTAMNHF